MINIDGLDEQILNDVYGKFCLGRAFWERLQFEPMFSMEDSTIICEIKCKQFGDMKRGLLFDNPMSSKVHQTADIKAATLDKVVIDVKFHCKNYGDAVNRADVFQLFNEYMNSLVMSQLEFKIPLVFSHTTRYRLMEHEKYIGTVSKCLDNSQTVTPSIVKIISKDKTSTTVFRILHDIVGAQKLVNKYKEHNGTTILPQVFEKTPTTVKRSWICNEAFLRVLNQIQY